MKKEINRTLGNSLRCILPSFWWKRLLGKMVDKIESAEESAAAASRIAMLAGFEASDKQDRLVSGSNIKTINNQSILGSGNITVSTDVIISRTVYPTKTVFFGIENDHEISETEREYNRETFRMVTNNVVMLKGDTNSVAPLLELTEESATFGAFKYQAVIGPEKMLTFVSCLIDKDGNVIEEIEIAESEFLISTIDEKAEIREFYTGDSLTDEQKAWNLETMEMVQQSKCIVSHKFTKAVGIFPANTTAYLSYFLENSFGFLLGVGVNSARAVIDVASDGTASVAYTTSAFTVDSSLSETSTNPVQNKAVNATIKALEARIAALEAKS